MCGSVWRAHIELGAIYCLVDRTLWTGYTGRTIFLSLSLFASLSLSAFSPPSSQSIQLSSPPFLPQPPTPPLTYLLKDIWLSYNCLSLSAGLSLLTRRISPLCLITLSLGQSVSHWMLRWQRYCRYCAAMLRNPGSIVNGSGARVMHV